MLLLDPDLQREPSWYDSELTGTDKLPPEAAHNNSLKNLTGQLLNYLLLHLLLPAAALGRYYFIL